jgi:hypothetical protein
MVESEGLLLALWKARAVGARRLVILTDSELVAGHIGKTYKAKKPDMMKYLQAVRSMEKVFIGITVRSFPRHYNKEADAIAKVNSCIKFRLDLQADKSPIVVKGPFFPRVVNPRYRSRGTNV